MKRSDTLTALLVVTIWGVNFVAIGYGLRDLPPLLFVALRFFFTAVPAGFFMPRPATGWLTVVVIGVFGCVDQFGLLFVAMAHGLPAGTSSVVIQSQAVFTFVFAFTFIHEVVTRGRIVGIAVAALGMVVIAGSRSHSVPLAAVLLALAGGASWGVANVVTRAARPTRPFSLLVHSALVAPLPLLCLSLATEGAHSDLHALTDVSLTAISSLTFVVLGATFVGFGLWYRLLSRYDSSIVAPYAILVPVVGLASAWVLTGERPSVGELAGSGIALAGVVMVTFAWCPRSLRGPTPTPLHIESPAASPGAFRRGR